MNFDRDKKYECTSSGVKVPSADGSFVILPPQPWASAPHLQPPPPAYQYRLSYDQMIGMFCLFGLFVLRGFDLHLMAIVGSIFAVVIAWRWLYRVAPVTAGIIFCIFASIFIELLAGG